MNRIIALERIGTVFHSTSVSLEQTLRRFVEHPEKHLLYTLEVDHRAYTADTNGLRRTQLAEVCSKELNLFFKGAYYIVDSPYSCTAFSLLIP